MVCWASLGGPKMSGPARQTFGPAQPIVISQLLGPALGPPGSCRALVQKAACWIVIQLAWCICDLHRRKRGERDVADTPGDVIVRKLTVERVEELKRIIQEEKNKYRYFLPLWKMQCQDSMCNWRAV